MNIEQTAEGEVLAVKNSVGCLLFAALLIALTLSSLAQGAENMIRNPGFEDGMQDWNVAFGGEGTENAIDETIARSGERSFFASSEGLGLRVGAVQNVRVSEPGRYRISAYFRAEDIVRNQEGHGVLIRVQFQDETNALVRGNLHIVGDLSTEGEWTPIGQEFDVPEGTHHLRIEFFLWYATGRVWWDDIVLTRVDDAGSKEPEEGEAPPREPGVVLNGSFDENLDGWQVWTPRGFPEVALDDEVFVSPPHAVRFHGRESTDRAALVQTVPIEAGNVYTISAWVKTEDVSSAVARIRIQFNSVQQHSIKTRDHLMIGNLRDTHDWTLLQETFLVPSGTGSITIEPFLDGASGKVWWDDIQLVKEELPVLSIRDPEAETLSSGAVRLRWSVPELVPVESFRIYRSVTPEFNVAAHAPIGSTAESYFIDRNTAAGRTYYYRIVPVDPDGQEGEASDVLTATVDTVTGVQPAEAFYAEWDPEGVRLTWRLPLEARARQVRLERAIISGAEEPRWLPIGMSPAWMTEHVDRTLPAGTPLEQVRYRLAVIGPEGDVSTPMEASVTGMIPRRPRAVPVGEHPSLFITADEIEEIKAHADTNPGFNALLQSEIIRPARSVALAYLTRDVNLPPKGDNSAHSNLATQARQAALGYAFTGDTMLAEAAKKILLAYAENYKNYPTLIAYDGRVTTQTLNESPWLIQLVWAYDLLLGGDVLTDEERQLIEEDLLWNAVYVIERYRRGLSNWQAWHNAAIGAVAFVLNDEEWIETVLSGPQSFTVHIREGLRDDGLWWEQAIGYHNYTVQALVYLAEAAYRNGYDLYRYESRGKSLKLALDAPLYHAFTDGMHPVVGNTSPSSRLAFSWTYGLGLLHYGDPRYVWLWQRTGSSGSGGIPSVLYMKALQEISPPDEQLTIGFGSFAPSGFNVAGSTLFADTGMALLRSTGAPQHGPEVALLYKPHGTTIGHQAPDNLTIMLEGLGGRWLNGPGSFDYDRSEQGTWYKQSVARSGVVVDETSQHPQGLGTAIFASDGGRSSAGELVHFVALPSVALATGATDRVYNDVAMERTVLVTDHYVLDRYNVQSSSPRQYDWVINVSATEGDITVPQEARSGTLGTRAGYQHISNVRTGVTDEDWSATWTKTGGHTMRLTMLGGETTEVIRAQGFGPSLSSQPMLLARRNTKETTFLGVFELLPDAARQARITRYNSDGWDGLEVQRPVGDGWVTDRFVWFTGDDGAASHSLPTGESFNGKAAFVRGANDDGSRAMIVLAGTELAAGRLRLTVDAPTDLAAEWADGGPVLVAHFGEERQRLVYASNGDDLANLQVFRIVGAGDILEDIAVELVPDVQIDTGESVIRWSAEPAVLYVVSAGAPEDGWLRSLAVYH